MFDYLHCDYPLPIAAVQACAFQTKSFDALFLDNYTLRADGTLWHTEYDIEDHSDPNASGLLALAGSMVRVNEREEPCLDFSGELEFHSDYGQRNSQGWGRGWVLFLAQMEAGCLIKLDVVEHREPPEIAAQREQDYLDATLPVAGDAGVNHRL